MDSYLSAKNRKILSLLFSLLFNYLHKFQKAKPQYLERNWGFVFNTFFNLYQYLKF